MLNDVDQPIYKSRDTGIYKEENQIYIISRQ